MLSLSPNLAATVFDNPVEQPSGHHHSPLVAPQQAVVVPPPPCLPLHGLPILVHVDTPPPLLSALTTQLLDSFSIVSIVPDTPSLPPPTVQPDIEVVSSVGCILHDDSVLEHPYWRHWADTTILVQH